MKTFYSYLTRKQIIVVWTDADGRHTTTRQRNAPGEASANRKMNALLAASYARVDAPRGWYDELLDAARAAMQEATK